MISNLAQFFIASENGGIQGCSLRVPAVVDALEMTGEPADRSLSVILSAGLLLLFCPLGRERITRGQYAGVNADAQQGEQYDPDGYSCGQSVQRALTVITVLCQKI